MACVAEAHVAWSCRRRQRSSRDTPWRATTRRCGRHTYTAHRAARALRRMRSAARSGPGSPSPRSCARPDGATECGAVAANWWRGASSGGAGPGPALSHVALPGGNINQLTSVHGAQPRAQFVCLRRSRLPLAVAQCRSVTPAPVPGYTAKLGRPRPRKRSSERKCRESGRLGVNEWAHSQQPRGWTTAGR